MKYTFFINRWLRGRGFSAKCLKFAYFSLFLGSFALMLSLSVLEGFHKEILNLAFKYDSNIKINTFDRKYFQLDSSIISKINTIITDYEYAPVIELQALVDIKRKNDIFQVKGSNPQRLEKTFELKNELQEGSIAISSIISKKYNLTVGEEIVLFYQDINDAKSNLKVQKYTISSIFNTGLKEIDENLILMRINDARNLARLNNNSTQSLEIWVENQPINSNTTLNIEEALGYPFYVRRAEDIHFVKIAWIEVQKQPIPIVLALISLVAVSNVLTTMLVLILEKFKSIGVMRALGMTKKQLFYALALKSAKMGLFGSITGTLSALALGLVVSKTGILKLPSEIYFVDSLPFEFVPIHLLIIVGISFAFSMLSALIPGYIAVRYSPIKAIRGF